MITRTLTQNTDARTSTASISTMLFDVARVAVVETADNHPDYHLEVRTTRGRTMKVGSMWKAVSEKSGRAYFSLAITDRMGPRTQGAAGDVPPELARPQPPRPVLRQRRNAYCAQPWRDPLRSRRHRSQFGREGRNERSVRRTQPQAGDAAPRLIHATPDRERSARVAPLRTRIVSAGPVALAAAGVVRTGAGADGGTKTVSFPIEKPADGKVTS